MDVSSSVILNSPKSKQYSEDDLKNYLLEYDEYKKIKKIFCDIILGLVTKTNIKNFGKSDYFTIAFSAYKLKAKEPAIYNEIVSNPKILQNACEEYNAERKTMKLALNSILTLHLTKNQHLQTDDLDDLLHSLSPKSDTIINFALIAEVLKINYSSDSEPSSPHASETPRKSSKSNSPNTLKRLKRKMSQSLKRSKDAVVIVDNKDESKSTTSVTFSTISSTSDRTFDRIRSSSSPTHTHPAHTHVIKSPRELHENRESETYQKLDLIRNALKEPDMTLIKQDDGSLKLVPGSINLDSVKVIVKELESLPKQIQEGQDKNIYCTLLKNLPGYNLIKKHFADRKDLFQRYLTLYISSKVDEWCLNKEIFNTVMTKYRYLLLNYKIPDSFCFKSRYAEIKVWSLVDDNKIEAMEKVVALLAEPFYQASQEITKETRSITTSNLDKVKATLLSEKHQKDCDNLRKLYQSASENHPDNLEFLLYLGNNEQASLELSKSENSELESIIKLINQASIYKRNLEVNLHSFTPDQLLIIINPKLDSMTSFVKTLTESITPICQHLLNNENWKKFFSSNVETLNLYLIKPRANFRAIVDLLDFDKIGKTRQDKKD